MYSFELVPHTDTLSCTGDVYCSECDTELIVVRAGSDSYMHPNYDTEWDVDWHEYHNIRLLHPILIQEVVETIHTFPCPLCSAIGNILILDNTEFDSQFVLKSLQHEERDYECGRCSETFYSHKAVIRFGEAYLCSDCAMLA
jgi:predicted RNA-binding Zn-ribbon protein involved in translation (DUF1610 family)